VAQSDWKKRLDGIDEAHDKAIGAWQTIPDESRPNVGSVNISLGLPLGSVTLLGGISYCEIVLDAGWRFRCMSTSTSSWSDDEYPEFAAQLAALNPTCLTLLHCLRSEVLKHGQTLVAAAPNDPRTQSDPLPVTFRDIARSVFRTEPTVRGWSAEYKWPQLQAGSGRRRAVFDWHAVRPLLLQIEGLSVPETPREVA